ncbi:uncharacterized protein LOC120174276 [Hibiscus syriacus]|nr:uncharacterized protein LOC120174276 [Hibiscus syriacus]
MKLHLGLKEAKRSLTSRKEFKEDPNPVISQVVKKLHGRWWHHHHLNHRFLNQRIPIFPSMRSSSVVAQPLLSTMLCQVLPMDPAASFTSQSSSSSPATLAFQQHHQQQQEQENLGGFSLQFGSSSPASDHPGNRRDYDYYYSRE